MKEKENNFTATDTVALTVSDFTVKGGWITDQQFMHQAGASFLLAHGLGVPVADAVASMYFPADGEYRLFVLTRNWANEWATPRKSALTPGRFNVLVDGRSAGEVFGEGSSEWSWQYGGTIAVIGGKHEVALHDLDGFDARCMAVMFTLSDNVPKGGGTQAVELKYMLEGVENATEGKGDYDLVVVGGGLAGICAAIAAARQGVKVALIHDRRVLGGNNSSEVRVGLGGRINIGPYPSLGYLLNEVGPEQKGNARPPETYEDKRKMKVVLAEPNITLMTGYKVNGVVKNGDKITSVIATEVDTFRRICVTGRLFADCTGDATLGVLAGARWRMGREARSEYGEPSAPDKADGMTMGASLQWYCVEDEQPSTFPDIDWGLPIDERTVQKVRRGQWYWEVGMRDDQIENAEKIRDYGMYVAYSNWAYLKNRFSGRNEYTNSRLEWVSNVMGKRESRRLAAKLTLREQDLKEHIIYPDASASTSWYIDLHYPDPDNSIFFPGREFLSVGKLDPIPFYPIPYRCFCSDDIENMFMAGRNIGVTHIALGTVRVMRTTAMMGEVVGLAASVCKDRGIMPYEVYTTCFELLRELMDKGAGKTNVPYTQIYTFIDTTGERHEDS